MPITFRCGHCNTFIKAPDSVGGNKGRCSKCGAIVEVPQYVSEEDDFLAGFDEHLNPRSHATTVSPPPAPPQSSPRDLSPPIVVSRQPRPHRSSAHTETPRSQQIVWGVTALMGGLYLLTFLGELLLHVSQPVGS